MMSTSSARSRADQHSADNGARARSAVHSGPTRPDPVGPVEFVEPDPSGYDNAADQVEQPARGDRSAQGMRRLRTPFTPEFTDTESNGTFANAA